MIIADDGAALLARNLPEADRGIVAARHQRPSVRREGQGRDRLRVRAGSLQQRGRTGRASLPRAESLLSRLLVFCHETLPLSEPSIPTASNEENSDRAFGFKGLIGLAKDGLARST